MKKEFLFFLVILVSILGCTSQKNQKQFNREYKIPVKVYTIHLKEIISYGQFYGKIIPGKKIPIFPRIRGKVIEKKVHIGDRVVKNAILARIVQDVPGMKFEPENIVAPKAGIINKVFIEEGAYASPQNPAFEIIPLEDMRFLGNIVPEDMKYIQKNPNVLIELDQYPGKVFHARYSKTYPEAAAQSGLLFAEFLFVGQKNIFYLNMPGKGKFIQQRTRGFILPIDAVRPEGTRYYVYRIKNRKTAEKVYIDVERFQKKSVIVYRGDLHDGDLVVIEGSNRLQEGSEVTILEDS